MEGVGDDALQPRWTELRRREYNSQLALMGCLLSLLKCFHHRSKGMIAEIPMDSGFPVPSFSTATLVAPPGGSKGNINWATQGAALMDPDRPSIGLSKFLYRMSPYYYTWRLAERMGIPVAAPKAYGGIDVPIGPRRSQTSHVAWLQFLSQQKISSLIQGLGLSIGVPAPSSLLDGAVRDWLKGLLRDNQELMAAGVTPILVGDPLSDEARVRLSLSDAYRGALGRVRSAEFYFRTPQENSLYKVPSVRRAAQKFQRKVNKRVPHTIVRGYAETVADLERKTSLFFQRSGGYLPTEDKSLPSFYGLERSGVVRERFKAPHLRAVG
jgi:hypothetical protein